LLLLALLFLGLSAPGQSLAIPITLSLYDFVIFSGGAGTGDTGGFETSIGGHTEITGNIGSNEDLFQQGNPLPGDPAQLNGSAYAGDNLSFGQGLTVGTSLLSQQVVANSAATIGDGVTIYGTLDAASYTLGGGAPVTGGIDASGLRDTFALITMPPATTFSAGGTNQTVETGQGNSLIIAPGTYGALSTSSQNQFVVLQSGDYYFDSITSQGGFTLQIDLTSGDPINIYVVGDVILAGNQTLEVKGAGTDDAFVPIDLAPDLASLIYLETHARFTMIGGDTNDHNIWGGTVYASMDVSGNSPEIAINQYTDWYGAAWALDAFSTADHGSWNYVSAQANAPEPLTLILYGFGFAGAGLYRRLRRKPK